MAIQIIINNRRTMFFHYSHKNEIANEFICGSQYKTVPQQNEFQHIRCKL